MRLTFLFILLSHLHSYAQNTENHDATTSLPPIDAVYPGGAIALKRYLADFSNNPPTNWVDSSYNKKGYIDFIVEEDGSISSINLIRNISPEADAQAIEIISKMPKWKPCEDKNGPVPCKVRLPIVFNKTE